MLLEVPINVWEALLGAKIEVPTLDGPITISIPPGSSGGQKLRLKGKGIQRGDERGDQLVVLKVIVPKFIDDDDRVVIEKLRTKHPINARADVEW